MSPDSESKFARLSINSRRLLAAAFVWLTKGLKLIIQIATGLVLVSVIASCELRLANYALEDEFYVPRFVSVAIFFVKAGANKLASAPIYYIGWYLGIFGIFAAACELWAGERLSEVRELSRERFRSTLQRSANIVGTLLAAMIFISLFHLPGRGSSRIAAIHYAENNPIENMSFAELASNAYAFHARFEWLHIVYVVTIFGLLIVVTIILSAVWSIGFWGVLSGLSGASHVLSRRLGLKSYMPIASITTAILGMALTLL